MLKKEILIQFLIMFIPTFFIIYSLLTLQEKCKEKCSIKTLIEITDLYTNTHYLSNHVDVSKDGCLYATTTSGEYIILCSNYSIETK